MSKNQINIAENVVKMCIKNSDSYEIKSENLNYVEEIGIIFNKSYFKRRYK